LYALGQANSYGNPRDLTGSWTVQAASGEFASIAIGTTGTDALHLAGAIASAKYTTP